jgi:hypothetical protein
MRDAGEDHRTTAEELIVGSNPAPLVKMPGDRSRPIVWEGEPVGGAGPYRRPDSIKPFEKLSAGSATPSLIGGKAGTDPISVG